MHDARTIDAARARHRWARAWVSVWLFRRRLNRMASTLGASATSAAVAGSAMLGLATTLARNDEQRRIMEEVQEMWEDA